MDTFDPAARLGELKAASERITSNLLELEGDSTVAMLDAADLRGVTADRWTEARQTLAELFTAHAALKDVIETATRLTGRPLLLTGSRLDELEQLLQGPSIVVSDTSLGLADRSLLSDSHRVVRRTVDQLIADMSTGYDAVKSVVVDVATIWDEVIPRLRAERARSVGLMGLAAELGVDDGSLAASSNLLREISETVLADPFAVEVAQLEEIRTALDRVDRDLGELRTLTADWPEHVSGARALLGDAIRAIDACAEAVAHANSRLVIDTPFEAPTVPDGIAEELEQVITRGDQDRSVGGAELAAWRRATVGCITEAESITDRCRSLLERRDDLRARLDAYGAKAARLGLLERSDVVGAFERAHDSLHSAPTDLGAAEELVGQYQQMLAARGGP